MRKIKETRKVAEETLEIWRWQQIDMAFDIRLSYKLIDSGEERTSKYPQGF